MKLRLICGFLLLTFVCFQPSLVFAAQKQKQPFIIATGLTYPGLNLRVPVLSSLALEGKYQFESESSLHVAGLRVYYTFYKTDPFHFYCGPEIDYLNFQTDQLNGSGFAAGLFAGSELFVHESVSIQTDIGPYSISLRDDPSQLTQSDWEWVINIGINYYWQF